MGSGSSGARAGRGSGWAAAVLETAGAEAVFFIIAWYASARLYGRWLSKVAMILLALLGVAAHGLPEYAFDLRNPRKDLKWILYVLAIVFGVGGAVSLGLAAAGLGSLTVPDPTRLARDALWYLAMVGFAEELFFRGYVQPRLNEVFTREYGSLLGFRCTWHQGTLITAVFYFGLPHLLTGVNPFTGEFSLGAQTLFVAASACFLGLIFGVMREKTGNVLLPTVTHFSVVYATFSLFPAVAGGLAGIVAPAAALFIFFLKPFQDFLGEEF
ncbi:MAG: hypothetical protein DRO01_03390 [Thermoproteota archaeon]|nr:MAG: hypothetical protein DRO01_03390 [Candidatus Korarchaeota archaeon]